MLTDQSEHLQHPTTKQLIERHVYYSIAFLRMKGWIIMFNKEAIEKSKETTEESTNLQLLECFEYSDEEDFKGVSDFRELIMNELEKRNIDMFNEWMDAYGNMGKSQCLRFYMKKHNMLKEERNHG